MSLGQSIIINEMMSLNEMTISDEDGDFSDWIELYNNGTSSINLEGYGITDDQAEPYKWIFPSVLLQPDSFLLIFASSKNRFTHPFFHTNFKINNNGEDLLLTDDQGNLTHYFLPIELEEDISYGSRPDGSDELYYFEIPSPAASNNFSNTLYFSHGRGFYTEPFSLSISSEGNMDQVYYTAGGRIPTTDSYLYQSPFLINYVYDKPNSFSTIPTCPDTAYFSYDVIWTPPSGLVDKANVIRARSFIGDVPTSKIYSFTYFVDSTIFNQTPYPIISLITDSLNLFSHDTGIYLPGIHWEETNPLWTGNYYQSGAEWERNMHIEYIKKNGETGFFQDAGVRIHGKQTRRRPQKTIRFYARNEYGKNCFDYKLLPEKEIEIYKKFLLSNIFGCWSGTMFKDPMTHDIAKELNMDIMDFRIVSVYINGEYWGIQTIREYLDENQLSISYDIDKGSIDLLKNDSYVVYGSNDDFNELCDFFENNDLSIGANYNYVGDQIDIVNFIDYQLTEIYIRNIDWPGSNIKVWRSSDLDSKWRWLLFDMDAGFGNYDYNMMEHATLEGGPGYPNPDWSTLFLRKLLDNEDFKNQFIERYAELLNTTFYKDTIINKISMFRDLYGQDIERHIERWNFPESISSWDNKIGWSLYGFANERPCIAQENLMEYFGLEEFGFDCNTTIAESSLGRLFSISPNPNKGEFIISFMDNKTGILPVLITDVSGKQVYKKKFIKRSGTVYLNVGHLDEGMYFIQVNSEEYFGTAKLIITN